MKGLLSGLVSILDVAPGRVLASLGMGFISTAAVTTALNGMITIMESHWNNIVSSGFQIISLAGIPTALGITVGAIIFRVSLNSLPKLGKLSS
jgi:hypothetical protein